MKRELLKIWIKRLGVETVKDILKLYVTEKDLRKRTVNSAVDLFWEKVGSTNDKVAPILLSHFDFYHQHIHLLKFENTIELKNLADKVTGLAFPGYEGVEVKFAYSDTSKNEIKFLLYVPFKISYHTIVGDVEQRNHETLHTAVLVRLSKRGGVISIMTFTKDDWTSLLPDNVIDARSDFRDYEILSEVKAFIRDNIGSISFSNLDFVSKTKQIIQMNAVDLYSASCIGNCESRHRTLYVAGGGRKRQTLKKTAANKVQDIIASPIITKVELVILTPTFTLPAGTRLTLSPTVGKISVSRHMKGGNLNGIQNYLFS